MKAGLVLQSHRQPLPLPWLQPCLDSVAAWARANRFDYRFLDDELFAPLSADLRQKSCAQPVIASDLARLKWLQQGLREDYACVIWCDADFLIFRPQQLTLPDTDFALGREVWVQRDDRGRLRVYPKVHNAFLLFRQGNPLLDFYSATAERLVHRNVAGMPPQFIGPKLLTALHNIVDFPVVENAGMLSPCVLHDLLAGGGAALDLLREHSSVTLAGANLSASLVHREGLTEAAMDCVIRQLLSDGI